MKERKKLKERKRKLYDENKKEKKNEKNMNDC